MKCVDKIGCTFNFGPVASPTIRGKVERFFGILENLSTSRLPSTTGNNPKDLRRNNPEKDAKKYGVSISDIENVVKLAIGEYNSEINGSGFSPNKLIKDRLERGLTPKYVPEDKRNTFSIIKCYDRRTIRGRMEEGRRPYISFLTHVYASEMVASSYQYAGVKVIIEYNPRDIREIKIYTQNGKFIDTMRMKTRNINGPFPYKLNEAINKYRNTMKNKGSLTDDKVGEYVQAMMKEAKTSKCAAGKLAIAQKSIDINNDRQGILAPNKPKIDNSEEEPMSKIELSKIISSNRIY